MTPDQFVQKYPILYHMATADALPQILKYGLLSSEATLDLLGIHGTERSRLLTVRRPKSVLLQDDKIGKFVLRDQIPMRDAALLTCLQGMTVPEWYRLLNERVFMWSTHKRVETLLGARAYRKTEHLILTIDTALFISKYSGQIELSAINSGATLYTPPVRGLQTFCPLECFESLNGKKDVVEVTVKYAIPDLADFILKSEVRKAV